MGCPAKRIFTTQRSHSALQILERICSWNESIDTGIVSKHIQRKAARSHSNDTSGHRAAQRRNQRCAVDSRTKRAGVLEKKKFSDPSEIFGTCSVEGVNETFNGRDTGKDSTFHTSDESQEQSFQVEQERRTLHLVAAHLIVIQIFQPATHLIGSDALCASRGLP